MLTKEGCAQRVASFWNRVPSSFAWALIGDPRHIQYFCDFRPNPISFSADQRSLLLLERSRGATLLADNFTRRTAITDPWVDREIVVPWYTHRKSVINRDHALALALDEVQATWSACTGLVEAEAVSLSLAEKLQGHVATRLDGDDGLTVGSLIRDLRRSKLPDEVALLRTCMRAGAAGHAAAFSVAKAGNTELDVYLAIQEASQREVGSAAIVYGDFRSTNADRHKAGGLPTTNVLQEGDLLILDFSVVVDGYRSDFTNTIAIGTPSEAQIRQFEACEAALAAAAATLRAGVSGADVYEAASRQFLEREYPPLAHHCGHGLGMEHPEPPILVPESTDILRSGDVVTIEPGLYVEGVGGMRFEHNYLITEDGREQLSEHRISLT